MKTALRIYRWIIISIVFQLAVYTVIDSVYLGNRANITQKMKVIPVSTSESQEPEEKGLSIPEGAVCIKVSYDNSYASYILDGKLVIKNIETMETVKEIENSFVSKDKSSVKKTSGGTISCYKWLPDKNTVMYAISASPDAPGRVQIFSYDADTDNEHIGVTFDSSSIPQGSEAIDLVISPLTMVTYPKIKLNSSQAKMYRIDIMDDIYPPVTVDASMPAKIGYYTENLIYQAGDSVFNIKSGTNPNTGQLVFASPVTLLDISGIQAEGKDRVYAGIINNQLIDEIIYGFPDTPTGEWTKLKLKEPAKAENIIIGQNGAIYQVGEDGKSVYNTANGSKTTIPGSLVGINSGKVSYLEGNQLKFKAAGE